MLKSLQVAIACQAYSELPVDGMKTGEREEKLLVNFTNIVKTLLPDMTSWLPAELIGDPGCAYLHRLHFGKTEQMKGNKVAKMFEEARRFNNNLFNTVLRK